MTTWKVALASGSELAEIQWDVAGWRIELTYEDDCNAV
jgi:hypothetical protein